jgi:AcrR family transcriptional regulator
MPAAGYKSSALVHCLASNARACLSTASAPQQRSRYGTVFQAVEIEKAIDVAFAETVLEMSLPKSEGSPAAAKSDSRVAQSQQVLREAFLELVLEKGFEAIRVSEVIRRANVNRSTFYRHYQDKRDLLRSWTQEVEYLLDAQSDSLEDPRVYSGSAEYLPAIVLSIFDHIEAHRSYYRLMVGRNGMNEVANDMELQICAFLARHTEFLELSGGDIPVEMQIRGHAGQFVGVVKWW